MNVHNVQDICMQGDIGYLSLYYCYYYPVSRLLIAVFLRHI